MIQNKPSGVGLHYAFVPLDSMMLTVALVVVQEACFRGWFCVGLV